MRIHDSARSVREAPEEATVFVVTSEHDADLAVMLPDPAQCIGQRSIPKSNRLPSWGRPAADRVGAILAEGTESLQILEQGGKVRWINTPKSGVRW